MNNSKTLPPPQGYASWLAYAIATMDVRSVQLETMFEDSAEPPPTGDEIRAAAQAQARCHHDEPTIIPHAPNPNPA